MIKSSSKTQNLLSLICMLLYICNHLNAQQLLQPDEIQAHGIGVKQGLSQGMINDIYQDKEGYMWIGTKDGLNRYDGYQITIFRNNPNDQNSLPDNYVNAMLEDAQGNFWIGTNGKGLFLFDKKTEKFYAVPEINRHKENFCIQELKQSKGKLFIKTYTNALVLDISLVQINANPSTASKTKIILNYNQLQPNSKYKMANNDNSYYNCSWMADQSLWVNFSDSIFHISPNASISKWAIKAYAPAFFGVKEKINGLINIFPLVNEPEICLVAYNNTIQYFNRRIGKTIHTVNLPKEERTIFKYFFQANDGNICSISKSSATIYNPKTKQVEIISTKDYPISYGSIISFFTDANGLQWFGTNGYGLIIRDPHKKSFKSYKGAHPSDIFWKIAPNQMPHIAQKEKIPHEFNCITLDKKGTYWAFFNTTGISSQNFLISNNTKTGNTKIYNAFEKKLKGGNIYNDTTDQLWLYYQANDNKNYIARLNKSTGALLESYAIPESIKSTEPYVLQFYKDKSGILWLATINGLYAFNEKTKTWKHWKNIPKNNNSLSANGLLSICPDPIKPNQYLWIGTEGAGFNRFDKSTGNCLRYDEKDGLPNNVAYCILPDSLNNLWISTNKGLSCFNPTLQSFRNFTDEAGLPGNEFNRITGLKLLNGELMFGGVDGFVIFNPKEVLKKQGPVPIVFTGISILNKALNWKTDSSSLAAPIGNAKQVILKPGQNIFSISFASLEYRNNAKKLYKYKLDGFEKNWTIPNSKNEVTYTNLSPGSYTFYVMGANTDGVWNTKPISLKVVVQPYWYQTIFFKIALLLLLGATLYVFYRFRLLQELKLEKLRNRIARDLHDEIGSTLSSISIYAESAKKVSKGNQKAENILSKINAGTSEMMEAMSDIVWAVNTGSGNLVDLANRMRSFAVQITEAKDIALNFTENTDIPDIALDMEQRKNIYLIYKEAISNAIKYSACTVINVFIKKEYLILIVHIRDNGKGFKYKSGENTTNSHNFGGNGIKNMNARAVEINSVLEIITEPDNGTSILLSMPLKKS